MIEHYTVEEKVKKAPAADAKKDEKKDSKKDDKKVEEESEEEFEIKKVNKTRTTPINLDISDLFHTPANII